MLLQPRSLTFKGYRNVLHLELENLLSRKYRSCVAHFVFTCNRWWWSIVCWFWKAKHASYLSCIIIAPCCQMHVLCIKTRAILHFAVLINPNKTNLWFLVKHPAGLQTFWDVFICLPLFLSGGVLSLSFYVVTIRCVRAFPISFCPFVSVPHRHTDLLLLHCSGL